MISSSVTRTSFILLLGDEEDEDTVGVLVTASAEDARLDAALSTSVSSLERNSSSRSDFMPSDEEDEESSKLGSLYQGLDHLLHNPRFCFLLRAGRRLSFGLLFPQALYLFALFLALLRVKYLGFPLP